MLAVLATAFVTAQAYAFTGTISFQGSASVTEATKGGVQTTTIKFPTSWIVTADNGDYSSVPTNGSSPAVTFNTVQYTGGNSTGNPPVVTGGTVVPQWTFTFNSVTYSFNLTALQNAFTSSTSMSLSGTGTAFIGGQSSNAFWALESTSGNKFVFKIANNTTTAVPDGGSAVALLGIALAGIEGARRMIRARKA
jgi:VPDSG-CTERM motif